MIPLYKSAIIGLERRLRILESLLKLHRSQEPFPLSIWQVITSFNSGFRDTEALFLLKLDAYMHMVNATLIRLTCIQTNLRIKKF